MIDITITKTDSKYIIKTEGHSGYAPEGEDIVCAGVSTVMLLATAMSIVEDGELIDMSSGNTEIELPRNPKTKSFIESLKIAFDTMKIRYGKYIRISFRGV